MKTTQEKELITYIETPRTRAALTKIDSVLEERIRAFKRARTIRRFSFMK